MRADLPPREPCYACGGDLSDRHRHEGEQVPAGTFTARQVGRRAAKRARARIRRATRAVRRGRITQRPWLVAEEVMSS